MLNKKLLGILVAVIVVLVLVGVWVGVKLTGNGADEPSEYSAVYLSSGDIYFGKLSWFPWPKIKNVWYIQRGVDAQNQPQLGLAPFTSVFWGPVDEVSLNPKEILFWTRLRESSQLVQAFRNPQAVQPPPANQQVSPGQQQNPTSGNPQ